MSHSREFDFHAEAIACLARADIESAEWALAQAVADDSDDWAAAVLLVECRLRLDRAPAAFEAARRAWECGVDSPELYWNWAVAAARLLHADTAEWALAMARARVENAYSGFSLLDWAHRTDQASAPSAFYEGQVRWHLGQVGPAESAFLEASVALARWRDAREQPAQCGFQRCGATAASR